MRGWEDEAASPKYAHIERERRWLVERHGRPSLVGLPHVLIEDRYIRRTRLRLRQMTDSATGIRVLKLTKKYESDDPLARPIVTAYLSEAEYSALSILDANTISKRRFPISHDGLEWSLDVFSDALDGIEALEIEAATASELAVLRPPAWATREVSDDPAYYGAALAARVAEEVA
jgi:CYTH domain-containing protein